MSMGSAGRGRKNDPLSKKIPQNPKYKNVKATVDTGSSITKYMAKINEDRENYKFRKDEIFKRMKLTTFSQLLIQINEVDSLYMDSSEMSCDTSRPETADSEVAHIQGRGSPDPSLPPAEGDYGDPSQSSMDTARSTLQSVISGVGEVDLNSPEGPSAGGDTDSLSPYLLLDVRINDAYEACHIITALNYPYTVLSRATNYETKEMLSYRNKPGKIILVYDDDEKISPGVATTLVQRGYDNLFMLSGGLKVVHKVFPMGFTTGTFPATVTGKTSKQMIQADKTKISFSSSDIELINEQMEATHQDKTIGGRLSKSSTASSRMSTASVTSRGSARNSSRPAFK